MVLPHPISYYIVVLRPIHSFSSLLCHGICYIIVYLVKRPRCRPSSFYNRKTTVYWVRIVSIWLRQLRASMLFCYYCFYQEALNGLTKHCVFRFSLTLQIEMTVDVIILYSTPNRRKYRYILMIHLLSYHACIVDDVMLAQIQPDHG